MFADYMRELQHVVLLRPDQEAELWRAYRRGGDRAGRQRLIESYQPLVFKVVMHMRPPEPLTMDLIQEGLVGLIEAVERFDPDRGVRFSTFATYRIRGRVLNALDRVRVEISLDQVLTATEDLSPLEKLADPHAAGDLIEVEDRALLDAVMVLIERLPARERAVLGAVVAAREPKAAAAELRISLSHFYRLQKQATERLRALLRTETMHHPQRAPGY